MTCCIPRIQPMRKVNVKIDEMEQYIAAVQMNCVVGDVKKNTDTVLRALTHLKESERGTELAVFPEMCLYGYDAFEHLSDPGTEQEIRKSIEQIAQMCKKLSIDAVIGAPYFSDGHVENALFYLDRQGQSKKVYAKTHLIAAEQSFITAGGSYGICQTPFGKAGFLICWDSAFAENARLYRQAGAELLIISAAWEIPYQRQWKLAVCARAFDNALPVVAANRTGKDGTAVFAGNSMIVDGMGNILSENPTMEEGDCKMEAVKWMDASDRSDFGSQPEELRNGLYQMKHMKFF